jgi:hypothetical protein
MKEFAWFLVAGIFFMLIIMGIFEFVEIQRNVFQIRF